MNSKALRRLAADHAALHNHPLPPNYLFSPNAPDTDDLSQLDILLAGPTLTPFGTGVWKLHLTIPAEYPQAPPTANFRTPIFHPNVDPQTGGVCVETLKRDWDSKLTLRDVLITISCLLIQPNPDSALNAEAGALIQENYEAFARRAQLMTSINAVVPKALKAAVAEAQSRGQEHTIEEERSTTDHTTNRPDAPVRRRATARQRGTTASRRSDGSPSGALARRRQQAGPSRPFIVQTRNDDVFAETPQPGESFNSEVDGDSSMMDVNQENDGTKPPVQPTTPQISTPRRPHGVAVPLGELAMDDVPADSEEDDDDDMKVEYPPSPRKSPAKSSMKRKQHHAIETKQAESSRDAMSRAPHITPPNNPDVQPLAEDSPFAAQTPSPRKAQKRPQTPTSSRAPLFPALARTPQAYGGIFKTRAPTSSERKRSEARRRFERDAELWELCGRDIGRWNRGDFDGEPFAMKARRW